MVRGSSRSGPLSVFPPVLHPPRSSSCGNSPCSCIFVGHFPCQICVPNQAAAAVVSPRLRLRLASCGVGEHETVLLRLKALCDPTDRLSAYYLKACCFCSITVTHRPKKGRNEQWSNMTRPCFSCAACSPICMDESFTVTIITTINMRAPVAEQPELR
jgi:hypothetical protein